ncbi:hypothetical protein VNO78_25740 [Psophocarpus tetragonolobus]|uniref:Uncharacterized protein n=1 Tax=Psophocarpus tetragonolobus TaxID=3891 RepID=A0AAN9XFL7_PSOTE
MITFPSQMGEKSYPLLFVQSPKPTLALTLAFVLSTDLCSVLHSVSIFHFKGLSLVFSCDFQYILAILFLA